MILLSRGHNLVHLCKIECDSAEDVVSALTYIVSNVSVWFQPASRRQSSTNVQKHASSRRALASYALQYFPVNPRDLFFIHVVELFGLAPAYQPNNVKRFSLIRSYVSP